jgi:hypothetical protein
MKSYFSSKTLIALAVAVAAAAAYKSLANEQPIPPPAGDSALPANIQPGSPVAQVIKLVQAGVDAGVIQNYISNCPSAFNLDADKIISLTDAGLPSDFVNAMFTHDKNYLSTLNNPAPAAPANPPPGSPPPPVSEAAPPPAAPQEVTVNNFYQDLAPYGSWVTIDGYGRCWRPNIIVYDSGWRPYCDRGQWVYTDCGWYWNSDYAWGATFHYGRWFCDAHNGWCWWPDTVWAPSWVTWRSSNDYCGWAPLPPYTAYQTGVGFTYRGGNVDVSFGFGLASSCYSFVSIGNFCEHHPRNYCVGPQQVSQFYNQTTVINNYNVHNKTIVNNGVSVTVIGNAWHHPIQQVPVGSIGNGGHRGWNNNAARHFGSQLRHGPVLQNDGSHDSRPARLNPDLTTGRRPSFSTSYTAPSVAPVQGHNGETASPSRPQASTPVVQRPQQNDQPFATRNSGSTPRPTQPVVTSTINNTPAPTTAPVRNPTRNNWAAGADNNRQNQQPVRTFTPPAVAEHPVISQPVRVANPAPVAAAPVITTDRPQRAESRQNYSPPAQHYVAPSAPATASAASGQSQYQQNQSQNFGNPYQGWAMRGH